MLLSEAIFLGSTVTGKAVGLLNDGRGNACALGAAGLALGVDWKKCYRTLETRWEWITDRIVACPGCGVAVIPESMIVHLNDDHDWSRERIADWVASIEPQETEEQIVTPTTGEEHVGGGVPTEICSSGKS